MVHSPLTTVCVTLPGSLLRKTVSQEVRRQRSDSDDKKNSSLRRPLQSHHVWPRCVSLTDSSLLSRCSRKRRLPSLWGFHHKVCVLFFLVFFYIFLFSVFVKATFPEFGCCSCYSSCAVCPTRSWRDRTTDLEKYFTNMWLVITGRQRGVVRGPMTAPSQREREREIQQPWLTHSPPCWLPVSALPVEDLKRKLHQVTWRGHCSQQLSISVFICWTHVTNGRVNKQSRKNSLTFDFFPFHCFNIKMI